ncbi:MCE family protein [Haloechinothrix sp. YIM 98757]|uniref:MCE family protein n=1 Tax=Haloechinothrix aidingensis TaxID=2752311 RepID=A0A838AD54_9PSEU|nr:MCE family protein [Haloechinothrix aidingensis]
MRRKHLSLRRSWERMRTVPGLGRNTLVVAALVLLGLTAATVNLYKAHFVPPWEERYTFAAEFENVTGVNPETKHQVTIAGVEVGQIVDWEVTGNGTALLEFSIEQGHVIHDDARAVMRTVNPLNQMYVEIDPGGSPAEPLPEGGKLPSSQTERAIQPDEVLDNLDERSQRAINALLRESDVALARAPEQLPGGLEATESTFTGLRPVMEALQTRSDKLSELMTGLSRIASAAGDNHERATSLADSAQETLGILEDNDADLRATLEELPGLNDELRSALSGTQDLTEQLDPVLADVDAAAESLPDALSRLGATTKQIGRTVDEASPVVEKARPVVASLSPLVDDVDHALDDARPISEGLDHDTELVTSYLTDLQAFVYNTSSVFSTTDARGTIIRGHAVAPLPDGGSLPGSRGGYAPDPEESGTGGADETSEGGR